MELNLEGKEEEEEERTKQAMKEKQEEREKGRCAIERNPGAKRGPSRRPDKPKPPEPRREIGYLMSRQNLN